MAAFGIVPHSTPRRSSQSLDAKRGGREDGQAGDAVALTGQRGQGAGPACRLECWLLRLAAWRAKGSSLVEKGIMSFRPLFFRFSP